MLTKQDVLRILKREESYLKETFGVKQMAIFGSFANGMERESSDIDIFMEFSEPIGLNFVKLADYLEEKLGRKIDILTPGGSGVSELKRLLKIS